MSSRPGKASLRRGHRPRLARTLARGPWRPDQVEAVWRDDAYEVPAEVERLADGAVEDLRERGSPAHDGMATRLADWEADGDRLRLELQPVRWALRLLDDASDSLTALCVVRSERAERSIWARALRRRSRASFRRSGSFGPRRCRSRR